MRKYCREFSHISLNRESDKDDCHLYSNCLAKAAITNKATKLPCDKCIDYKKIETDLNPWKKRLDGYVW